MKIKEKHKRHFFRLTCPSCYQFIHNIRTSCLNLGRQGFSLIELMIAVAMGAMVSLGVATVFVFSIEQFTILVEQNAAEESALWSSYQIRSFFSQAVDIKVSSAPIAVNGAFGGQLIDNYVSGTAGNLITIAAFDREASTGTTGSQLYSTAVYFVEPTGKAVGSSNSPWGGALIFDVGSSVSNTPMIPSLNDVWYDRISSLVVSDVECTSTSVGVCTGQPAKAVTFTIKTRYFKTADKKQWIYGGVATAPYRDIEMMVKVGLRNNVLRSSSLVGGGPERLNGNLYFYKMNLPPLTF